MNRLSRSRSLWETHPSTWAAGGAKPGAQPRRACHKSSATPAPRTFRTHLPRLRLALLAEPSHHVEPVLGRPPALRIPPPATRDLHLIHLLPGGVTPYVVARLSPILGREAPPPARGLNQNRGPATPHGRLDVEPPGAPTGSTGARSAASDSTLPIFGSQAKTVTTDTRARRGRALQVAGQADSRSCRRGPIAGRHPASEGTRRSPADQATPMLAAILPPGNPRHRLPHAPDGAAQQTSHYVQA